MARREAGAGRSRRPLVFEGETLHCGSGFEDEARAAGYAFVAGVDEVGRGALCGPVTAAAVVLGTGFDTAGLDDSKRLTRRQREAQAGRIRRDALAVSLGAAEPAEIDRLNVLQATLLAMQRAVLGLPRRPDLLLVDALTIPGIDLPQRAIVKGDARSVSIAAASIVAKVARDGIMRTCDARHPGYGLAHNMGYASADHRAALRQLGPSSIHRRSFQGTTFQQVEFPWPAPVPSPRAGRDRLPGGR